MPHAPTLCAPDTGVWHPSPCAERRIKLLCRRLCLQWRDQPGGPGFWNRNSSTRFWAVTCLFVFLSKTKEIGLDLRNCCCTQRDRFIYRTTCQNNWQDARTLIVGCLPYNIKHLQVTVVIYDSINKIELNRTLTGMDCEIADQEEKHFFLYQLRLHCH